MKRCPNRLLRGETQIKTKSDTISCLSKCQKPKTLKTYYGQGCGKQAQNPFPLIIGIQNDTTLRKKI